MTHVILGGSALVKTWGMEQALAPAQAAIGSLSSTTCPHCGNPIPPGRSDGYCCAGCLAVHRLLAEAGLGEAYARLRPARINPLLDYFERRAPLAWLPGHPGAASGRLDLAVEGIQCGACVWAIEKLALRQGPANVGVNSALGRLSLAFDPARFDVRAYLNTLADFGYRVRPLEEGPASLDPSRGLLLRLGVSVAVTMNTMSFSLPFYLGLSEEGSPLSRWLRGLSLILTSLGVAYGGSYFFARAWRSLRAGIAHFDIPVALGLLSAYAGSLWAWAQGRPEALYLDSVNVFLSFMLLGRFLQERALLRSRRSLLKGEAFSQATVTALGPLRELPWAQVQAGQRLLLQAGCLCPCEARLGPGEGPVEFDLASLTGERQPLRLEGGATVPAGARLLSNRPVKLEATASFEASALARLLPQERGLEDLPVLWRWSVKAYVGFVLCAAFGGLAYWWPQDPARAAQVFISVLVVTCPCGLGIAVPLARTLADQRLARAGLTVRQPGLLERVLQVRQVCLDKTGTLTLADLRVMQPEQFEALGPEARRALLGAAGASRHPVSRALFRELSARGGAYPEDGQAEEIPGHGVRYRDASGHWFLGRAMRSGRARAELSKDGSPVAAFDLEEQLLMDGPASLLRLRALGLGLRLLSGDRAERVLSMARSLGLKEEECQANCSPQAKAVAVAQAPSLMLGDGLNDSLALRAALVSGSPSWEGGAQAQQADLSFSSGSLHWLPELFATAQALRRALWANLGLAWSYNLALVALALTGAFSPLLCAVTMPGSSLLVSLATTRMLRS